MDARITILKQDDQHSHLELLSDWLSYEPELHGRVRKSAPPPGVNELGGVVDAIAVVLGSGTASALALALKTWLAQPRKSDITIRVEAGDRSIEIDAKRITEGRIESMLEQALRDESSGEQHETP
ncbi:hypothetical protein ACGFI3_34640 [Nonomuraea wenchangensis]|uniref:effector-associated constant component EACC1 n=1 Tax=Nonomuraea wenchangensis TaxID=568860 RepID=UPI003724592D